MNSWYHDRPEIFFLQEIRDKFKNEKYHNVEVWRLLGANITLAFWQKKKKKKKILSELLFIIYVLLIMDFYKWFLFKISGIKNNPDGNPILIEALSDEQRLRDFWLPVAKKIGNKRCVLLTESRNIYDKYNIDFDVIMPIFFSPRDWIKCRFFLIKNLRRYYLLFLNINQADENYIAIRIHFLSLLIIQFSRVIKANYIVESFKPKVFITSSDWHPLGSAMCATLRALNIPTITYIHGAMGKQSFIELVPINANYIVSWGNTNTSHLVEYGVNKEQILECGVQRLKSREINDFKNNSFTNGKKNPNNWKKTIVIPFTALITDQWIKDFLLIVDILKEKFNFICRPHPSTPIDIFEKIIQEKEGVQIIYPILESITKTLSLADYVIVDSSTAGFDAILMNKIVFVVDTGTIPKTQDVMLDVCEAGAAIMCRSTSAFFKSILEIENNEKLIEQIRLNSRTFLNNYIKSVGDEATENIVNEIESIIKKVQIN